MTRLLTNTLDTVLDRRVVPGLPEDRLRAAPHDVGEGRPAPDRASAAADRLLPLPPRPMSWVLIH
ncbi:MAG: hypothetical protein WCG47_19550 [Dermatophilaceae bacterium]